MCDDYGIPPICYTFKADLNFDAPEQRREGVDACKWAFEAAVNLGCSNLMTPTPGKAGIPRYVSRRNWIAGLKDVMPFAEDAGVDMTVENFPGAESPFVTADDLLEAVNELPGFKITFDSGNAASGEDPVDSFKKCAAHVVHAHFKDWNIVDVETEGYRKMLNGKYFKPALIGEGDINNAGCLKAMIDAGYDGCINIEYESNKYDPYEGTKRALEYLRSLEA
jgi:sugar phosphate isomerase/epimerase